MNVPQWIIVHHEAPPVITAAPRFAVVNEYHKSLGFPRSTLGYYCGYHYFIEKTGAIIRARRDEEEGAHTRQMNLKSIGICLAGNFDFELPTGPQIEALRGILKEKSLLFGILPDNIVPHRKFAPKTCYGSKLSDSWAKDLLTTEDKLNIIKIVLDKLWKLLSTLLGHV